MYKVKIKMPLSYYETITEFLSDLDVSRFAVVGKDLITQQILSQSLIELNRALLNARYSNCYKPPRTIITKSFPSSYGLNFFGLFYGNDFDGHCRIAINEMCRQLEEQLFIKGNFKLPNYVSSREN